MMSQPIDHALEPSFVIGPQFIVPHPLEVIVEKYPCRSLVIKNTNHKILLKVIPYDSTFHRQRLLLNANNEPLVMLREKKLTMHKQWVAFMGESKSGSEMIFSTKKEHVVQFSKHINVMLGNKSSRADDCYLKIEGSLKKRNCTIYTGDFSKTIAQMHELPQTLRKTKSGEDKFMVTIRADMDYAFVVALFAIVDAMENTDKKQGSDMAARIAVDL